MDIKDPQLKAITTIDRNVAVNAGAGTGKTKVLTERFVYILEHGELEEFNEIESIVAITFTKKATQEMIERIRGEIRKNFHKGDVWRRYYRDLEKSNISTIHSFCGKLLRENPIEGKIDPLFEVLEDYGAYKLLMNTIVEVLEENLEFSDDFFKLMKIFKINRIDQLVDDFYSVYNNIRTVGISMDRVKSMTMDYLNSLKINREDLKDIKETIIYLSEKLAKNANLSKMVKNEDPIWVKFHNDDYKDKDLYNILEYILDRLGNSTKEVEHFNRLRMSISNVLKTKDIEIKWLYNVILDILISIDKRYENEKHKLGVLDYDDLQIKVLKLLEDEKIRDYYQKKFKYFMIDEFQDTNELQKKIFYKLTSEKEDLDRSNLFIVGDPKQSIYGFRGSDLNVFYNTMEDIKNTTKEEIITMGKNYRTKGTVLNFINNIFTSIMDNKYDPLIPHKASDNSIDIEVLENQDLENFPELKDSEKATIYEANLIAKRIKTLVLEGEYDYGDFALLFRSTTRNHIYEEALKNYSIPYYNSSSKRYFYRQEILDIINGLKTISNPYDNIATIGFLRSPMVGISDISLYFLLKSEGESLFEKMTLYEDLDILNEDKEKIILALEILNYFYSVKDLMSILNIADELIEKTYFIETLLLKSNGKQAMANVYKFLELIKCYEVSNKNSLEFFIDYVEEMKSRDESEAIIESEDSNVVKLLTIHKSKGLEFPVVIIPEMCRDSGGIFPKFLFSKEIGIGIKTDYSSGVYDFIKADLSLKEEEEKERVLYVAMTRAKNMLILGNQGRVSGFKKLIGEYLNVNEYKSISDIDLNLESNINIKLLKDNLLLDDYEGDGPIIPLLTQTLSKKSFESFSISQYLVFKDCRRKYYMDYYHGRSSVFNENLSIETSLDTLSAIDKGNIIHKFCQFYKRGIDIEEYLRDTVNSFGVEYDQNIKELLMPYINNFLKVYREDYDEVYLERPFYIKIGSNYLNGVIDRINIKSDNIEILDIKTNKLINKDELILQYKPQLQLYAYAVEKILNRPVNKASILFLESGEVVDIPIDDEELKTNMASIAKFIDFVENNDKIEDYSQSPNCNYCKYKSICN